MRLRTLVIALSLTLAGGLALPGQLEARSRHNRHRVVVVERGPHWDVGWRGPYGYYRPYAPYRNYRYDRYYEPPYYDNAYRYRSYRRGPLHFHGRVRCYLPHLSIHIGW